MERLIALDRDTPGANGLRAALEAYGERVETIPPAEPDDGQPAEVAAAVVVIPLGGLGFDAIRRVEALRGTGYKGRIAVVGVAVPEVDVRQRLTGLGASFIPALSGPGDVAPRIRQLLT